MKVVTIGKGNVGGGLAELWRNAGHVVTELGREGGDATGADAALLAVPAATIAEALGKVKGLDSVPVIDSTNVVRIQRPDGFDSLSAYVKSLTGGPVAKAFNANFARLYDRLGQAADFEQDHPRFHHSSPVFRLTLALAHARFGRDRRYRLVRKHADKQAALTAHRMRGRDAAGLDCLGAQPAALQGLQAEVAIADRIGAPGITLYDAPLAFSVLYPLGH